jgi:hypothetical protein
VNQPNAASANCWNALAGKNLSSALQLVAYHEDLLFWSPSGDAETRGPRQSSAALSGVAGA